MKANELRIGNYIQDKKDRSIEILQVESLANGAINHWMESVYQPISLTEEWLIKFGAIRNEVGNHGDEGHVIYYELEKLTVCDWGNGLIMSNAFAHGIRVPLQFVHQLQNLYFALTGEELIGH